jgi:hypothetical protein
MGDLDPEPAVVKTIKREAEPPRHRPQISTSAAGAVMLTFMILMGTAFSLNRSHSWSDTLSDAGTRQGAQRYLELARADAESALTVWRLLDTRVKIEIGEPAQRAIREAWLGEQTSRLHRELEHKDCDAAVERLRRMQRLLPDDARVPARLGECQSLPSFFSL